MATKWGQIPKRTILSFLKHDCPAQAAALSYYTVFSLPPLLLVAVTVAGMAFERSAVVSTIYLEVHRTLGEHAAKQVVEALAAAQNGAGQGTIGAAVGILVLFFTATGAFTQLQANLNRIWEVTPDPKHSEIRDFFLKRIISFGMVLSLGFLLMASLLLSAMLAAASSAVEQYLPGGLSAGLVSAFNSIFALIAFAGLFAAIYKVMPDVKLQWRHVIAGGIVTSLLFAAGRTLIGLYLSNSDVTNAYGAAASLALILLWTYYASMLVLFGAEFTRTWTEMHEVKPPPETGAVRAVEEIRLQPQ
jgi:membrane protein